MEYVRSYELGRGDVIVSDGTIPCLRTDRFYVVKQTRCGEFYVECEDGEHFLEGQYDPKTDSYLGIVFWAGEKV